MTTKQNKNINLFFSSAFGLQYLCLLFYSLSDVVGSTYWNIRYTDNGDLWADFTKWFPSFNDPSNFTEKISIFPILRRFDRDYFNYLRGGSPYTNDPQKISDHLSNFHMPPFSGLFSKFVSFLSVNIGPSTVYSLFLLTFFGFLIYQLIKNRSSIGISKVSSFLLCFLIIFDYPMQFAITKGNTGSIISTVSLICSAIFMSSNKKKEGLYCSIFASLNRPNLIFLPLLISLNFKPIIKGNFPSQIKKYGNGLICLVGFYLLNSTNQFILWLIDRNYSFENFKVALKTYHEMMAYGDSGIAFGSALLGFLKLFFKPFLGLNFRTELPDIAVSILLYACLLIGTFLSFYVLVKFKNKSMSFEVAWISLICLNLILTPVFADYHLSIFISSLILYLSSRNKVVAENMRHTLMIKERIFYIYTAVMIAPWQIYVAPSALPYGLGALIRPVFTAIILFWIFTNSKKVFLKKTELIS